MLKVLGGFQKKEEEEAARPHLGKVRHDTPPWLFPTFGGINVRTLTRYILQRLHADEN